MAFFQNDHIMQCSCCNRFNLQYLIIIPKLNNYLNMLFCIHSPLTVVCFKISIHKYSNTSYLFERILLELKKNQHDTYIAQLGQAVY